MNIRDMIATLEREIVPIIRSWESYDSAGDLEHALNEKITDLGFGHTPEFHTILDAMSFSNFRIDWRMFLYFRPDFYKKIKC